MGIEYRHYVMPASRSFRPGSAQILELIAALRKARWVADPEAPSFRKMTFDTTIDGKHAKKSGAWVKTAKNVRPLPMSLSADSLEEMVGDEAIVCWPVARIGEAGLEYPFEVGRVDPETYYDLQLHFAADYVHHVSEVIEPLEDAACCGRSLEFDAKGEDIFYASRIKATCAKCKRVFDPSKLKAGTRDPWTGEEGPALSGGGAYRFALVVDCGKWLPRRDAPVPLSRAFKRLCEKTLGQKLVDVGDLY